MKGLDTNILVRFLTADEPNQSEIARSIILRSEAHGERFHVSTLVLVELAWVLQGTRYRLSREETADTLHALLETAVFVIQDRDLVRRAVEAYRRGPADFSDYLIGEQDRRAGCDTTLTFDRRLATAEGFEEPSSDPFFSSGVSEP